MKCSSSSVITTLRDNIAITTTVNVPLLLHTVVWSIHTNIKSRLFSIGTRLPLATIYELQLLFYSLINNLQKQWIKCDRQIHIARSELGAMTSTLLYKLYKTLSDRSTGHTDILRPSRTPLFYLQTVLSGSLYWKAIKPFETKTKATCACPISKRALIQAKPQKLQAPGLRINPTFSS